MDRALCHDHAVARRPGNELQLSGAVDPEGPEVARVDADHAGAEAGCALELLLVVRLHKRVEPELVRCAHQARRSRVVEVAEDEKCGIGACLAHLT